MLKYLIFLISFLNPSLSLGQAIIEIDSVTYDNIIGLQRETVLDTLKPITRSGGVIGEKFLATDKPEYTIGVYQLKNGKLILVSKINWNVDKGESTITDQIFLEIEKPGYVVAYQMCWRNNRRDSGIFTVAKNDDADILHNIIQAWDIDFENGHIQQTSTKNIYCESMFSAH